MIKCRILKNPLRFRWKLVFNTWFTERKSHWNVSVHFYGSQETSERRQILITRMRLVKPLVAFHHYSSQFVRSFDSTFMYSTNPFWAYPLVFHMHSHNHRLPNTRMMTLCSTAVEMVNKSTHKPSLKMENYVDIVISSVRLYRNSVIFSHTFHSLSQLFAVVEPTPQMTVIMLSNFHLISAPSHLLHAELGGRARDGSLKNISHFNEIKFMWNRLLRRRW